MKDEIRRGSRLTLWMYSPYTMPVMWLPIHAGIKVIHVNKMDSESGEVVSKPRG